MAGIRGHSPWEALPVFLVFIVVLFGALRKQEHGLTIGLALAGGVVVLYVIARVVSEINVRLRRYNLQRLRDLAGELATETTIEEARGLTRAILEGNRLAYRDELDGMTSFLEAARKDGEVARNCRTVLFKLAPWSESLERDIAAMRYKLPDDELAAWLEWFLDCAVGWEHFSDRVADVAMYALPRIPEPERKRLLERAVSQARPRDSWKRFGQVLRSDLASLDTSGLSTHQRSNLQFLLGRTEQIR
jgi:hypothetical protein